MTTTPVAELTLLQVNPAELGVRDQARADSTPDEQLVESVRANGILQPPTVTWDTDQARYVIIFGHRRVGAAIAAGLTVITVIDRAVDPGTVVGYDAIKLEQQIVENERRKGLTPAELAQGYANLETMFGQTPEDIATALAESPDRIRAGIRAAQSKKTTELLETAPHIDLAQAAVIAEFDAHPKHQKELAEVATDRPQNFSFKVESIREAIAREDAAAALVDELKAKGVRVLKTDQWGYVNNPGGKIRGLEHLVNDKGTKLTARNHAKCEGHAAAITGFRPPLRVEYFCTVWSEKDDHHQAGGAVKTAEQLDAERAAAEREAAVEANRAARREWIADLLPGKINQLPGVYDYMAAALLRENQYYNDHRAPALTLTFLRREAPARDISTHYADAAREVAPFRMMLATALAIHEASVAAGNALFVERHMTQLQRWGYQLSDIDREALTSATDILARAEEERRAIAATADEKDEAADDEQQDDGE